MSPVFFRFFECVHAIAANIADPQRGHFRHSVGTPWNELLAALLVEIGQREAKMGGAVDNSVFRPVGSADAASTAAEPSACPRPKPPSMPRYQAR